MLKVTPAAKFIWRMTLKLIWHKYNCFGLRDARKINDFLIWSIIPTGALCYCLMYFWLPAKAIDEQWFTLFVTKAFHLLALAFISYHYFKGTRNAGMSTAVLVYCGINFASEVFGFTHKLFWFNTVAQLFFLAMAFFIIRDVWYRTKKDNDGEIL